MEHGRKMNRWLRMVLFTAGSAMIGFLYYIFFRLCQRLCHYIRSCLDDRIRGVDRIPDSDCHTAAQGMRICSI